MRPIVVRLMGGLGNQLFQVICAEKLRRSGRRVSIDTSFFDDPSSDTRRSIDVDLDIIGLRQVHLPRHAPDALERIGLGVHIVERGFADDIWARMRPWTILVSGYFQSWSAADSSRDFVAAIFDSHCPIAPAREPYVAAHARLGDYLSDPRVRRVHGVTDPQWLLERAYSLADATGVDRVRLFSDQPDHVVELCGGRLPEWVDIDDSVRPWEAIAAMRSASGLVLSNSSLSWWAAYAATDIDRRDVPVIMPMPWMSSASAAEQRLCAPGWSLEMRRVL